jgi:hypothetical protein
MKKQIPLSILEALQPLADENVALVKAVKNTEVIFHLIDKDEHSHFFYKIIRQEHSNAQLGYIVEFQPRSKDDVSKYKVWLKIEQIIISIQSWLLVINAYNKIHTIYDDPIMKNYQEKFEKQFDILDEDAEFAPFDLQQQIFLDDYLTDVKTKILALKEGRTELEITELTELENEASEIKKILTKETKKVIIKKLTRFFAKAQKIGLDVIKEVFVNITTELAKKILTEGI